MRLVVAAETNHLLAAKTLTLDYLESPPEPLGFLPEIQRVTSEKRRSYRKEKRDNRERESVPSRQGFVERAILLVGGLSTSLGLGAAGGDCFYRQRRLRAAACVAGGVLLGLGMLGTFLWR